MKVLIFGGTGFVGVHIVRAFVRAGHQVAVAVRPTSDRSALAGLDVEFVVADVLEPDTVEAACRGREWVVHSAGIMALWKTENQSLYETNVFGTRAVVRACLKTGVKRLIYTGSVGIYGGTHTPDPVNEEGSRDAARFHSFHVTSMCLAESEVYKGMARGLEAVLVHPSFCFGEGDRGFHSSWCIVALAKVGVPFVPPGGLNIVDVLDVAHAHVLAAEKSPPGECYLIGGENLTNRAFADLLAELLGLTRLRIPLTRKGLRGLGNFGEVLARVSGADRGGYTTLNHAMGQAMGLYWFFDDTKARKLLGYTPSPVRPAVQRQVDWLRERGFLPETGFGWKDFYDEFLGGKYR